jgi:FkbM family methyltransferase
VTSSGWNAARWARDVALRLGLLGPFEPALLRAGFKLFPPPSNETVAQIGPNERLAIPAGFASARSYLAGTYEREVTRALAATLQPGGVFLDGGANIGYFTLLASRAVGATGRVLSAECDPRNLGYLHRNVTENHCENVTVLSVGLTSAHGARSFLPDPAGAEGHLTPAGAGSISVDCVTIDELVRQSGCERVDLVKLDLEGGETDALRGMVETSRRNPRMAAIVEYCPRHLVRSGSSPSEFESALRDLGFRTATLLERDATPRSLQRPLPGSGATYNLLLRK